MNLYIKTNSDGNFEGNPVFEDNLIQVYGGIPAHYELFIRIECPSNLLTSPFQKAECTYTKNDTGVWQDTWTAIDI